MFYSPGSSEFDLRFRLFGFPIQVSPMFWLSAVLIGMPWYEVAGPMALFSWIGVMFVSILIHELGHAFAARSVGFRPWISLYFLGGLASYEAGWVSPWKRVYIALAGPMAGFALYGICVLLWLRGFIPVTVTLQQLLMVNFYWNVLNLLPVFPLDGGRVIEGLASGIFPRKAVQITHGLGAIVGALVAIYFFQGKNFYMTLMFGSLAFMNIQMLQANRY